VTTAVIGNGAGGCAAAVTLSALGRPVRLAGRRAHRREAVEAARGLTLIESGTRSTATDIELGEDPAAAVNGASHVVLMVPTPVIPAYAELIAPALDPDALVLLAPGHTGGVLAFLTALRAVRPTLAARIRVAETFTLPYVARMTAPAEVTVWRRMRSLLVASRPVNALPDFLDAFEPVFPDLTPVENVLVSSLSNPNAILHPPGMLGNIGWIERTGGDFLYYREGITQGIGRIMAALDEERLAIGRAYGFELSPFLDLFEAAGLVEHDIRARGDIALAVHESGPNREIRSPSTMTDRYVAEDVGFGLVAMRALAERAGVTVPTMDALILLASHVNAIDYGAEGLTAERLGIAGLHPDEIVELARG